MSNCKHMTAETVRSWDVVWKLLRRDNEN